MELAYRNCPTQEEERTQTRTFYILDFCLSARITRTFSLGNKSCMLSRRKKSLSNKSQRWYLLPLIQASCCTIFFLMLFWVLLPKAYSTSDAVCPFWSISKDSYGKLLCTGLVKPSTPVWGNVKWDLCNTWTVQRQNISSGFSTTAQFHCCTPRVWLFQPQSYYRLLFHIKYFFSASYSHLRLTLFYNSFSRFFTNLRVPVWREWSSLGLCLWDL